MVNLQVLGASILFIDLELSDTSKEIVVNTSVGIAFVQFLGITFFHCYKFFQSIISRRCSLIKQRNVTVATQEEEANYYDMTAIGDTEGAKCGILDTEYLEDYAVNVDVGTQ